MRSLLIFFCGLIVLSQAEAQEFKMDADLRMRYEHRNGYGQPRADSLKPADFVVQRTRINLKYQTDKLEVLFSPQNVRVWGDSPSGTKTDINGLQMHQAWVKYKLNTQWALKAGRQELNYDDARILGNVDWTMQGRSHDAVVVNFNAKPEHIFHAGLAVNAMRESNFLEVYSVKNQYKNMQYLWYSGKDEQLKWSFLFLNQGLSYANGQIAYNQTSGFKVNYDKWPVKLETYAYLQSGRLQENVLKAYMLAAKASLKTGKFWQPVIGFEYLSGKDQNAISPEQRSFNPWYGTNHKFNGYMDYFYVGNHLNSTGLTDLFGQINYAAKKMKWTLSPHWFASAANLYSDQEVLPRYLGTEIDVTAAYQILPDLNINAGYSKIWISDSMVHLKGGQKTGNQWLFVSLHCHPELFSNKR